MAETISQFNFELNIKRNRFTRTTSDGSWAFQIVFLDKKNWWELIPGMSIRKNLEEVIYHKVSGFAKETQDTPTITISTFALKSA